MWFDVIWYDLLWCDVMSCYVVSRACVLCVLQTVAAAMAIWAVTVANLPELLPRSGAVPPLPTPAAPPSRPSSGLSAGATAGVVVSSVVVAFAVAGAVLYWVRLRRTGGSARAGGRGKVERSHLLPQTAEAGGAGKGQEVQIS